MKSIFRLKKLVYIDCKLLIMKQLSFLLLFFLASCSSSKVTSNGQPFRQTNTVEVDPATNSDELYIRARRWFVDEFKSAKDVLQVQDKQSGELIGKGTFPIALSYATSGYVFFTVSVFVKDGNYKYEFKNYTHKGEPFKYHPDGISYGLITTDEKCPYRINGILKGINNKNWKKLQEFVEKEANEMAISLNNAMKKSSGW